MPPRSETTYALALSRLRGLSLANALLLYRTAGSATAVFEERRFPAEMGDKAQRTLQQALDTAQETLEWAQHELAFCHAKGIRPLTPADPDYPRLLTTCDDAPLVLFYRGTADLNAPHTVAVVGTRRITEQGRDLCTRFCADLAQLLPDAVVVSGLAYGVDITAHRAALSHGLPTIGTLAHGLDRIYPALHRPTAVEMLSRGGLLTEYATQTAPKKEHFIRRNRIVAGLSAATVVVESAERGGALITARLAQDYGRSVFAFPGRTTDAYSAGCNRLIRDNEAALITSAEDLVQAMGWTPVARPAEPTLFPQLSEEETALCRCLEGTDRKQINRLAVETDLPVHRVSALLFELELKGLVKPMAGGCYRLLT